MINRSKNLLAVAVQTDTVKKIRNKMLCKATVLRAICF
ncbi:hypothetical protein [Haemophilus influenzae]|nr:hypothetical protein [Haemophilus influenzae]